MTASGLLVAALLLAPDPSPAGTAAPAAIRPSTPEDEAESARRLRELESLEEIVANERGRPTGSRVRERLDGEHRLVVLAQTAAGATERAGTFEPAPSDRALFVLLLDARRRVRLLVVQPEEGGHRQGFRIEQYLFDARGDTVAHDDVHATSLDCVDGRLHERRVVTTFRPPLRALSRTVEFTNDLGAAPPAQGCALPDGRPPFPTAAEALRELGIDAASRAAGVVLPEASVGRR